MSRVSGVFLSGSLPTSITHENSLTSTLLFMDLFVSTLSKHQHMKMCKSRSDGRSGKGGGWLCAEDKKAEEGERRIDPPTGFDHPCKNLS